MKRKAGKGAVKGAMVGGGTLLSPANGRAVVSLQPQSAIERLVNVCGRLGGVGSNSRMEEKGLKL